MQAVCTGRDRGCGGAGHAAERTSNMYRMSVTLELSKLSGWLNADAACRESKRGHTLRGEGAGPADGGDGTAQCAARCGLGGVRALGGGDAIGMCTGRARLKAVGARARVERTRNMPHMVVTLDVSKLSGWLNADCCCRVERRAYDAESAKAREA